MKTYATELQALPQWVCWRIERRKGKSTKIPINPHTGGLASVDDPSTWGTFADALSGMQRWRCHGMGFVFTSDDLYCGVDLDNCIAPETGKLTDLAKRIVERLRSYTAWSQSRKGLHIIVRGKLPPGRLQGAFGGLYDQRRFFALTGNLFPGSPLTIEDRQFELEALHAELFPAPVAPLYAPPPASQPVALADTEILDKMFDAQNGTNVRRLWEGDISGYTSHSEADLALCSHLAFWCSGDASRIDALFRQSGLYREKKWGRQDYRERTIGKALERSDFYTPPRQWHHTRDNIPRMWDMRAEATPGGTPWHQQ